MPPPSSTGDRRGGSEVSSAILHEQLNCGAAGIHFIVAQFDGEDDAWFGYKDLERAWLRFYLD